MAGRTEVPGPTGDNFWSWRETMYRFVDAIGPDDMEAIAAFAYMEMLEAGFTRVGEFHYVHHDRGGQTILGPRRDGEPHRRRCTSGRDRLDALARILRPFRLRGRGTRAAAVALRHRRRRLRIHCSRVAGKRFPGLTTRWWASPLIAFEPARRRSSHR